MAMIDDLEKTAIPLDEFRQVVSIDPYNFWQMTHPAYDHAAYCDYTYTHYRWLQPNHGAGRADFINALASATRRVSEKLGYWPVQKYEDQEVVRLPRYVQPVLYNVTPLGFQVAWRRVVSVGTLTWTSIQAGVNIVASYSAASDDVTFTVVLTSATDACEIVVCYPGTHVRIRPVDVTVTGLVATITIKKWLLGNPTKWLTAAEFSPDIAANMLSTVDVYRRWIDTTDQITLAWEPDIYTCGCLDQECHICQMSMITACAGPGNYKIGFVKWQAAQYEAGAWAYKSSKTGVRQPDIAYISYEHGLGECGKTDDHLLGVISHFALALLPIGLCGCDSVMEERKYWQEDLGRNSGKGTYTFGSSVVDNTFGLQRGAIEAWSTIRELAE